MGAASSTCLRHNTPSIGGEPFITVTDHMTPWDWRCLRVATNTAPEVSPRPCRPLNTAQMTRFAWFDGMAKSASHDANSRCPMRCRACPSPFGQHPAMGYLMSISAITDSCALIFLNRPTTILNRSKVLPMSPHTRYLCVQSIHPAKKSNPKKAAPAKQHQIFNNHHFEPRNLAIRATPSRNASTGRV